MTMSRRELTNSSSSSDANTTARTTMRNKNNKKKKRRTMMLVKRIAVIATAVTAVSSSAVVEATTSGSSSSSAAASHHHHYASATARTAGPAHVDDVALAARYRGGGGATQTTTTSTSATTQQQQQQQQQYRQPAEVRTVLHERLVHVLQGKRTQDIATYMKVRQQQRNGNGPPLVYSMHGVSCDNIDFQHPPPEEEESSAQPPPQQQQQQSRSSNNNGGDPFPTDRMNLDLPRSADDVAVGVAAGTSSSSSPLSKTAAAPPSAIRLMARAMQLAVHFFPIWIMLPFALVSTKFRQQVWYPAIARCLANAGAAFIKLGQWCSTRNDMLPESFCQALAILHNTAPAHPASYSRQLLESSLEIAPGSLDQVLDEFDEEPLASGSIAQVHRATVNQIPIAIKVRHPNVAQQMDLDFRLMGMLAACVDVVPPLRWLHIRDIVSQFSHTMAAQSYLNVEAHHLEILNHNFRRWGHVQFPRPFYASSTIIMETFEAGKIVTNVLDEYDNKKNNDEAVVVTPATAHTPTLPAMTVAATSAVHTATKGRRQGKLVSGGEQQAVMRRRHRRRSRQQQRQLEQLTSTSATAGLMQDINTNTNAPTSNNEIPIDLAKFLVTTGAGVYLKMLLVDNLMHADLHPGNIMIDHHRKPIDYHLRDNSQNQQPPNGASSYGITLVDAGMVAQLTEYESRTFIGMLAAIGEGDGAEAAHYALQFSEDNTIKMSGTERRQFVQEMKDLFAQTCGGYGTRVEVGNVLRGILSLIRKHHVKIDANYATLSVNLLCVESLARRVCPRYNLLDAAKPLLQSYRQFFLKQKNGAATHLSSTSSTDEQTYVAQEATTSTTVGKKSKFVLMYMSLMYWRKQLADNRFFRREARKRQQQHYHNNNKRY